MRMESIFVDEAIAAASVLQPWMYREILLPSSTLVCRVSHASRRPDLDLETFVDSANKFGIVEWGLALAIAKYREVQLELSGGAGK
jgi:hypothetical protein